MPAFARAQSAPSGPAIGIWAGFTSTTFRGSDAPGPANLAGFSAGVSTRWRLASHFALQPELDYVQKGSEELDLSNSGSLYAMHIHLNYVEVPVLFRADASPVGPVTPFAQVGPEVAFKLGCGIVVSGLQGSYTCADLPAQKSVDYGGVAGAGMEWKIGGRAFELSARFDLGLADAFEGNNAKNRATTILLGTVFR